MAQPDFEIITYNAKCLGDAWKQKKIFNYMKKKTSSNVLVMIQKTCSTRAKEQLWKYQWGGAMFFSHGTSDSKGVLVPVRNELECKMLSQVVADSGGRYVILHIELQESPYVILNYYAPDVENEQLKLLNKLFDELDRLPLRKNQGIHFIFGGDWNLIFDKSLDALSGIPTFKKNAIVKLKYLIGKVDLVDIWRLRNPAMKRFTWKSSNPFKMR